MLPWARLDKDGFLQMFRNGKWKVQFCPLHESTDGEPSLCGDWCPLFRNMSSPTLGKRSTEKGKEIMNGIGFYLACQGAENPVYIFSKVWHIHNEQEIDEFGKDKEPTEN